MDSNEPIISTNDCLDSSPTTPRTTSNIRTLSVFQPNIFSTPNNFNEENQQDLILSIQNDSLSNLPIGIASLESLKRLESIYQEKSIANKQSRTILRTKRLNIECHQRINRANFFFKDVETSMAYVDIFDAIGSMFPLVQLKVSSNLARIQYLCVADTSSENQSRISIHLCFQRKVNFNHLFLNTILSNLKIDDYFTRSNNNQFNNEIKLLSKGKYIESSMYFNEEEKDQCHNYNFRVKQTEVASAAFRQDSFSKALGLVKEALPYEYMTMGSQIRNNLEYEFSAAKKRKFAELETKFDRNTFKLPLEHQNQIEEWLDNDFKKRIAGELTRSRCLFLIGPTQLGKTSWAKSLGNYCCFSINFSLKDWCDDVDYLILDDINWKDIKPISKGLLIAPGVITLTDKYCSKTLVHNNKPCIMCLNDEEGKAIVNSDPDRYWKKNGVWIFLKEDQKLF